MKKTTIYLDDNEYKSLRNRAFIEEVSVAELLRRGARLVCSNVTPKEHKAMHALERIRKNISERGVKEEVLNKEVIEAQRFVRKQSRKKTNG